MAIEFASPFALIHHFCRAAQDGYPTKEMILVLDLKLSCQDLLRVNRDEVERGPWMICAFDTVNQGTSL